MKLNPGYLWSLWKNNPRSRVYFMVLFLIPVPVLILLIAVFYRLPCTNKTTEEIRNSFQMGYEIEKEKAGTSDKEMKVAMDNWERIRRKIPHSYEAVSNLIFELNRFVSSKGFEMDYTLGELDPDFNGVTGLSLLPVNLKLKVKGIDTNQKEYIPPGLDSFVTLLHDIVKIHYGVDLSNVVVKGMGNGIKTMEVRINIYGLVLTVHYIVLMRGVRVFYAIYCSSTN